MVRYIYLYLYSGIICVLISEMKIICVGLNYKLHNKEMDSSLYKEDNDPILFMKPESALLKEGNPFFIPDFSNEIHYEAELVVKISRVGKNIAERFAHRYYDDITVGIDFTARDLQRKQIEYGFPWEVSKAFDNSAVIGGFVSKEKYLKPLNNLSFSLFKNEKMVQQGEVSDMIHSVDKIIAYASRFYTLKVGDLIYTGTPSGVGRVEVDDHLTGFIEDEKLLDFYIK